MAAGRDKTLGDPAVVVITGAGGGIGAALANVYAAPGVTLGLIGRDEAKLNRVAGECRARGATAEIRVADVTTPEIEDVLRAFDAAHPIDLLIANAGVTSGVSAASGLEPWDAALRTAETNFVGALRTIAPVAERMAARGRGQIAGIGSLAALAPLPYSPAYSASKAGLETYVLALRHLLAPKGVRLNVVTLGYVETDMSRRLSGPKPFLTTPAKAAIMIRSGLKRNRARIAHPVVFAMGIRCLNILPEWLVRLILPAFAFTISP
ncbi:SDR family NAD(P)-dependent oxidoreductase [Parvibaculum sp.]|uniref:SDR family NAD(P)-dependent oxidoreductase n=1 Tax=Parvibaculum sp. TaxID=2024848 RepID=UPI001D788414|nr:SDR family NAD(P)-dependent oxidoreductase [Parvibaculum sp.]MBX3490791.1 SDR family NAD(P)-dependent oxidoreductase [Parvibaculum sp.]MCW5728695.1 SDR family NAD(P)-dependent oxidoreductase [Parvibaculum sp.]